MSKDPQKGRMELWSHWAQGYWWACEAGNRAAACSFIEISRMNFPSQVENHHSHLPSGHSHMTNSREKNIYFKNQQLCANCWAKCVLIISFNCILHFRYALSSPAWGDWGWRDWGDWGCAMWSNFLQFTWFASGQDHHVHTNHYAVSHTNLNQLLTLT